jgi:hypothetical protein
MTTLEELQTAIEQLEEAVTRMALLVLTFRRLLRDLNSEDKDSGHRVPDFDYRTGMPWEKK